MKNSKMIILLLVIITLYVGCFDNQVVQEKNNGFFAWMDAYIAVEENTPNTIATTLFLEDIPFSKDSVADISFLDISNDVIIDQFWIDDMKQPGGKFFSYAITLEFTAKKINVYETSGIIVTLKSNENIEYSIGKWVIDVNKSNEELVNTWNSPVATANAKILPYDYSLNPSGKITKIYYGDQLFISNDDGIKDTGSIDISKDYQSPIVYIKTKIIINDNQNESINYGKGTYCGALSLPEEVIIASKEHNN